ncbi:MAG: hypothetical protein ACTSXX_09950 [Candidatus Baldrarchaeia archaeon]
MSGRGERERIEVLRLARRRGTISPKQVSEELEIPMEDAERLLVSLALGGYLHGEGGEYWLTDAGERIVAMEGGRLWMMALVLEPDDFLIRDLERRGFMKMADNLWFRPLNLKMFRRMRELYGERVEFFVASQSRLAARLWFERERPFASKRYLRMADKQLRKAEDMLLKRRDENAPIDAMSSAAVAFMRAIQALCTIRRRETPKGFEDALRVAREIMDEEPVIADQLRDARNKVRMWDLPATRDRAYEAIVSVRKLADAVKRLIEREKYEGEET